MADVLLHITKSAIACPAPSTSPNRSAIVPATFESAVEPAVPARNIKMMSIGRFRAYAVPLEASLAKQLKYSKGKSTYEIQNRVASNANDINPFATVNITLKITLSVTAVCNRRMKYTARSHFNRSLRLTIKDLKMPDQLQFLQ